MSKDVFIRDNAVEALKKRYNEIIEDEAQPQADSEVNVDGY